MKYLSMGVLALTLSGAGQASLIGDDVSCKHTGFNYPFYCSPDSAAVSVSSKEFTISQQNSTSAWVPNRPIRFAFRQRHSPHTSTMRRSSLRWVSSSRITQSSASESFITGIRP